MKFFYIVTLLVLIYLLTNTGLHGDDYIVISSLGKSNVLQFLNIEGAKIMVFNPVVYYSFWWPYFLFGSEHQWAYDVIKIATHAISIFFIYKFSTDYFSKDRSFFVSLIFVLYPLHDATAYWYMTAPYVLIPSTILYAHHLIRNNHIKLGASISILGAFSYYITPPYIFGLATIFLFEKQFKKAIIFITPGLLYVAYYFWIKFNLIGVERRISSDLSVLDFLKQMLIQPLSFLESAIGPSYWLKIFYAIESISLVSIIIVAIIMIFSFNKVNILSKVETFPKSLFAGLVSILILSFGMYALTGLYSHSAFNLGNRSTVYGSLLIVFLLVTFLPSNKKSAIFLLIIFLAPVFGLSDHWKSWNSHQKTIIENIKNNKTLEIFESNSTLIITGNLYSNLGPFSHIEFFSMPWNVQAIFENNVKTKSVVALTPYIEINGDYLVDTKFGGKYLLKDKLYIYDSNKDTVKQIFFKDIPALIKEQPVIIRHWVQLFKDTWIQNIVVWLSPRLLYLFK